MGAADGGAVDGEDDDLAGDGVAVGAAGSPPSVAVAAERLKVGIGDADRSAAEGTAQPVTMTSKAAATAATALISRQRFIRGLPRPRGPHT